MAKIKKKAKFDYDVEFTFQEIVSFLKSNLDGDEYDLSNLEKINIETSTSAGLVSPRLRIIRGDDTVLRISWDD